MKSNSLIKQLAVTNFSCFLLQETSAQRDNDISRLVLNLDLKRCHWQDFTQVKTVTSRNSVDLIHVESIRGIHNILR